LQQRRFAKCAHMMKGRTAWLASLDLDEFVYPRETFRAALHALPPETDWVYLTWQMTCAKKGQAPDAPGLSVTSKPIHRRSGKSFIRPEFFRDSRHEGVKLVTNGIASSKSNSLHKWVPLPGKYNATKRMVVFSLHPGDNVSSVRCGSGEIGNWPCRSVLPTHGLRHLRYDKPYRQAAECHHKV